MELKQSIRNVSSNTKMVVIVSKEGQLANRIGHASFFIANSREYGYRVVHTFFDDYYSFFSESLDKSKNSFKVVGKKTTPFVKVFQKCISYFVRGLVKFKITRLPFIEIINYEGYAQDSIAFDLNDEKFVKKARTRLVLAHGWLFQDTINRKKHRQLLLETWKPNRSYQQNIDKYLDTYRKDHDLLIGVHIRRGDYKKFESGKWYYSPQEYYKKMEEVATLGVFKSKKIAFVICTNEKDISMRGTDRFSVFNEQRHFIEDLYLLAKCDYIIGPPSTFSVWASFYGNVPLYMIRNIQIPIDDLNFSIDSQIF